MKKRKCSISFRTLDCVELAKGSDAELDFVRLLYRGKLLVFGFHIKNKSQLIEVTTFHLTKRREKSV